MVDFSKWLQSTGGANEQLCVLLIAGAILCVAAASITNPGIPGLLAVGCLVLSFGLSAPSLESEIQRIWGLREVSSECDLPAHELPVRNMKCYVTNGKGHKELVEIRVSKDGTRLGLYDMDGKALKQTEKE